MTSFATTEFPSLGELSVRDKIARILGIANDPQAWQIKDSFDHPDGYGSLVMVRYSDSADMETYGRVNGVVVDVEAGAIVAASYGHTPITVTDEITVNEEGKIVLTDITGVTRSFDAEGVKFKMGLEGVILRVYKWGGIVFVSSHTKLDVSRSVWGSSLPFLEIYMALGGPTSELFDERTYTSPICHIFQVVDPSLLVATKINIGVGMLAYLGPKQMWNVKDDSCPYKQTDESGVDEDDVPYQPLGNTPQAWMQDLRKNAGYIPPVFSGPANFVSTLNLPLMEPVIYYPQNLALDVVNNHLRRGYWHLQEPFYTMLDPRLTLGEFVTMYWTNEHGQMEQAAMQIQSPAYNWRKEQMRGNAPHLQTRFYDLLNSMYAETATPEGIQDFVNRYPLMLPWPREVIGAQLNQSPLLVWPTQDAAGNFLQATASVVNAVDANGNINELASRDQRAYNIWAAFLMAVPLVHQASVYPLYEQFYLQRQKLINWLVDLSSNSEYESLELGDYVNGHIRRGIARASAAINEGRNIGPDGRPLSMPELTANYIATDIMQENTVNIRRMLRAMKSYKSLQAREEVLRLQQRTAYAHSLVDQLAMRETPFPIIPGVNIFAPDLVEYTIVKAHKLLNLEVDPTTGYTFDMAMMTGADSYNDRVAEDIAEQKKNAAAIQTKAKRDYMGYMTSLLKKRGVQTGVFPTDEIMDESLVAAAKALNMASTN